MHPVNFNIILVLRLAVTALLLAGRFLYPSVQADSTSEPGENFFGKDQFHVFRIELKPERMESLRRTPRHYVSGVIYDGNTEFRSVGIHLKGSGTFQSIDQKPSFTLSFVKFGGPSIDHLTKIHLNNSAEDPTYANEKIGSEIFERHGIAACRVTRALVYLNGRRLGFYTVIEGFTPEFTRARHLPSGSQYYELKAGEDFSALLPWFKK